MKEDEMKSVYLQTLSKALNEMRLNKILSDLEMVCKNESFYVHAPIMSASSGYFRNLLCLSPTPVRVLLQGVQPDTFRYLLNFIYTGSIDDYLDVDKLRLLIETCEWLEIPDLFRHAGAIASEIISYNNCLTLWNLAEGYNIYSLRKEAEDFFAINYLKLSKKSSFMDISTKKLKSVFGNKNFHGVTPEDVLSTLHIWSEQHPERQRLVPFLMHCFEQLHGDNGGKCDDTSKATVHKTISKVDNIDKATSTTDSTATHFPVGFSASYEYFNKDHGNTAHPINDQVAKDLYENSFLAKRPPVKDTPRQKIRNNFFSEDGYATQSESITNSQHDSKRSEAMRSCNDDIHSTKGPMREHLKRSRNTMLSPRNAVTRPEKPPYQQSHDEESRGSAFVDDFIDCAAIQEPELPVPIVELPLSSSSSSTYNTLCLDNSRIIIFGKQRPGDFRVQSFSMESCTWDTPFEIHQLLTRQKIKIFKNAATVIVCNRVYIMGGCDNKEVAQTQALQFEFDSIDLVKALPPMSIARSHAGIASVGARIYLVGGKSSNNHVLDHVECYSLATNEWSPMAPFPVKSWGMSLVSNGEMVYSVGGRKWCEWGLGCYAYDSKRDQWSHLNNLPRELNGSILVTLLDGTDLYALRHHNSSVSGSVCILNLLKNMWTCPRVGSMGRYPKKVLAAFVWQTRMWVVSCDSRLYIYNLTKHIWEMEFPFQRLLRHALYASIIYYTPNASLKEQMLCNQ